LKNLFDLTGQVCLVTGSTKGIGRAMATRMAQHGAQVVVSSRSAEDSAAVADHICALYGANRAIGAAFDLADRSTYDALERTAIEHYGRVDTFVGNAVSSIRGRLGDIAPADAMTRSFELNVVNNAELTKYFAPAMIERRRGSIIYTLSTLGIFASPPYLPYSLAKAALKHMTAILAVDYGPSGVRVNAVCPGIVRTFATTYIHSDPERVRLAVGDIPLQRMGEADELAAAAIFLASPGGGYVTGQTIVCDGGQTLQGMEGARNLIEKSLPATS